VPRADDGPVVVVGGGIAGLAAAAELAATRAVTLVERLPVAGGVLGYEAAPVRALEDRCRAAGVRLQLGTTAVRFDGARVLTVGPGAIRWLEAAQLVYAGGGRPATQAELRILGPRLAGVLPATVAIHFAEAGVVLGRRVAIVGTGDWATAAAHALALTRTRCAITVVAAAGAPPPAFEHDGLIAGWTPCAVEGDGRVGGLVLERDGQRHRVACDAVILADDPRPLRNVDGAVHEDAERVHFVQPVAAIATHSSVAEEARAAVRALLARHLEVRS
jgi:NADPH-dependent 2,4-dienoyl-CoA reductase/sulfur reductase-like enzyme